MQPRIRRPIGLNGRRRGVTLVEMLVVVALVVLMMTILVQIFQSATGAMSLSRTTAEMDVTLRQIESIIRSDLAGVTAKMTPPNDPKDQRGYFEYGENAPADLQGEDSDDYLAFTTKAPDGTFFTGRQMIAQPTPAGNTPNYAVAPISSQVAEVVYFLRNGNLYRRVFLVAPDRAQSIQNVTATLNNQYGNFPSNLFGSNVPTSWQGLNDISCRPNPIIVKNQNGVAVATPVPNTLGDLTNRQNRRFAPRFANDFGYIDPTSGKFVSQPDNVIDDLNGDGLPDYYPTLYTDGSGYGTAPNAQTFNIAFQSGLGRVSINSYNVFAFPFIYPGMYTFPQTNLDGTAFSGTTRVNSLLGWSHYMAPGIVTSNGVTTNVINHSPLAIGDNLVAPVAYQTWWGFPTWRETMTSYAAAVAASNGNAGSAASGWVDPMLSVATNNGTFMQPLGLQPFDPTKTPTLNNGNLLPPIATFANPLPDTDLKAGSPSFIANPSNPRQVWEDDLLLTGVRSFDVKAYDLNAPFYNTTANGFFSAGYQDLGYGSTDYELNGSTAGYIYGPNGQVDVTKTLQVAVPWQGVGAEPVGFGHEGRIPPLSTDYRFHPRKGNNIGDDGAGVIRLTRVWDSWSTDYTNAPDTDIYLTNYSAGLPAVYPSFPPPYPSPLRGIQVQIRMTDARGERTKAITIRHDFTDKLN